MASPAAVLSILVTANTGQASAQLARLQGQLKGTQASAARSSNATGAAITKGAKTGALAVGALTAASVVAAAKFEDAFADVRKTVDATEKQFDRLESGLIEMSKQIPVSASDLAHLAGEAGALGVKSKDLLKFTRTAADLGVATDMSAEMAANALARLSNIMGRSLDRVDQLGAILVELGNKSAATESEISEMALRIASAGRQVGLSSADVLGFSAALTSVGVRAEAGGTAISKAFIIMATAVDKGGTELSKFAQVAGMSSDAFAQLFQKNAALALVAFTEGLERMRKNGESIFPVMEQLGVSEIRLGNALRGAATSGDLFRKTLKVANEESKRGTALTEEANKRYATTAAQFQIFKNRVNALAIAFGTVLLPAVNAVMKALGEDFPALIGKASEALKTFHEESAAFRAALVVMGVIAKATGEVIKNYFEGMHRVVKGTVKVISGLLTGNFGRAWDGVKDIFKGSIQRTLALFSPMKGAVGAIARGIGDVMGKAFRGAWNTAKDVFNAGAKAIGGFFGRAGRRIASIAGGIRSVFSGLAKVIHKVADFIVHAVNRMVGALGSIKDKIGDVVPGLPSLPSIPNPTDLFKQRGGPIPGMGDGDRVRAMLEPGEFVVNKKAVKQHRALIEAINQSPARFAQGGIVRLGRQLQRRGYQVGEHPAFGGVTGVHVPGSYHYQGKAIDVNWPNVAQEPAKLDALYRRLKKMRGVIELLWRVAGHFDHLHVAMSGRGGALGAIGGAAAKIPPIEIGGKGPLADMARGATDRMRRAANRYLAKLGPLEGAETGAMSASGDVQRIFARVARKLSASKVATLALGEAGFAESGMRDLAGGHSTSSGALQLLASTAGSMNINPHDEGAVASAFFLRGFFGRGGANKLAAQGLPAHLVAQGVQGSAFPSGSNYAAQEANARRWMKRYGLQRGGVVGPFVGSFDKGGEVGQTGLGLLHKGEHVLAMQKGGEITRGLGLERVKAIRGRLGEQINRVIPKLDEQIDIAQQLAGLSTSPAGSELSKGELQRQIGLQQKLLTALRKTLQIAKRGLRIVERTIKRIEDEVKRLERKIRQEQRQDKPDREKITEWQSALRKHKSAQGQLSSIRPVFREAITEMAGLTGRGGRIFDASLALKELRASGRPQALGIGELLEFAEAMRYGAFRRPAGMAAAAAGLPTFHQGGVVPGPRGASVPVMAKGGEVFLGAGQGVPVVEIKFADGMGWLKQFVQVEIKNRDRHQATRYRAGRSHT